MVRGKGAKKIPRGAAASLLPALMLKCKNLYQITPKNAHKKSKTAR